MKMVEYLQMKIESNEKILKEKERRVTNLQREIKNLTQKIENQKFTLNCTSPDLEAPEKKKKTISEEIQNSSGE